MNLFHITRNKGFFKYNVSAPLGFSTLACSVACILVISDILIER